jgi:predicted dehydrogenase
MAKIRWGVIGSGGIARRRTIPEGIAPAANAELVSVFDTDAGANRAVALQYGAQAASNVAELLASGIDAVYVASPAFAHCAQILECAEAGKHVLAEKPLALDVAEAERVVERCRAAGVKLATAFMMRFHAQHQAALALVREGAIGTPVYARAQLSCWYPPIPGAWRQAPELGGGGSLMDMGGHCLDLLEMFLGPVERVACVTGRLVHAYQSEDSATVLAKFRSGAAATVDTCFCIPDDSSRNVLEVYGSKGSILAQGTIGQGERGSMLAYLTEAAAGYDAGQARAEGGGIAIDPAPVNMYRAEIEAFSQALIDGGEPPVPGEDGLRSQRVLAACYQSARGGAFVEVEKVF